MIPLTHTNDQVQRSNEGIFVGLKGNQYKVYDPRMNKFLYSDNVTFDENVGNFAMQKLHASMQIPQIKTDNPSTNNTTDTTNTTDSTNTTDTTNSTNTTDTTNTTTNTTNTTNTITSTNTSTNFNSNCNRTAILFRNN